MADFANYTPGEYAKEHIRITPTTLADGRDFFYLDDDPEFVSGARPASSRTRARWTTVSPRTWTPTATKCRTPPRRCAATR